MFNGIYDPYLLTELWKEYYKIVLKDMIKNKAYKDKIKNLFKDVMYQLKDNTTRLRYRLAFSNFTINDCNRLRYNASQSMYSKILCYVGIAENGKQWYIGYRYNEFFII